MNSNKLGNWLNAVKMKRLEKLAGITKLNGEVKHKLKQIESGTNKNKNQELKTELVCTYY